MDIGAVASFLPFYSFQLKFLKLPGQWGSKRAGGTTGTEFIGKVAGDDLDLSRKRYITGARTARLARNGQHFGIPRRSRVGKSKRVTFRGLGPSPRFRQWHFNRASRTRPAAPSDPSRPTNAFFFVVSPFLPVLYLRIYMFVIGRPTRPGRYSLSFNTEVSNIPLRTVLFIGKIPRVGQSNPSNLQDEL